MMHYSIVEGRREADMKGVRRGEDIRVKTPLSLGVHFHSN